MGIQFEDFYSVFNSFLYNSHLIWECTFHFLWFVSCLDFLLTCLWTCLLLFCPNFDRSYNVRLQQVKWIVSEKCQNRNWNHKWKLPTTFNVWLCKILPFHIYVFHYLHNMLYMKSIHNFVVCVSFQLFIVGSMIFSYQSNIFMVGFRHIPYSSKHIIDDYIT
jgi:hypothetical protein